jgi:hypothetical protein
VWNWQYGWPFWLVVGVMFAVVMYQWMIFQWMMLLLLMMMMWESHKGYFVGGDVAFAN